MPIVHRSSFDTMLKQVYFYETNVWYRREKLFLFWIDRSLVFTDFADLVHKEDKQFAISFVAH